MAPNTKTSVMTGSGRYFDPYNPTPESVHLPDIARGLKRGVASRFNGQLLDPAECPHPQSGASHSMRVARLCFARAAGLLPGSQALDGDPPEPFIVGALTFAGLVHDSPEGYLGDELGPIKTDERKSLEAVVLSAIVEHLIGPKDAPFVCGMVHDHPTVAWADTLALFQEALIYQPGAVDWALPREPGTDGLAWHVDIARTLHLFHPREGEDWRATTLAVAEHLIAGPDHDTTFAIKRLLGV